MAASREPPLSAADGSHLRVAPNVNWSIVGFLLLGWLALYLPTYIELGRTIWVTDEQSHGPIILAVSAWLLFEKRRALAAIPVDPKPVAGASLLVASLLTYTLGRSQHILVLDVGSQISMLVALLVLFIGVKATRLVWFPLFFLIFMVPLPEALVAAVTGPLKSMVSAVASEVLHAMGYPIGRAGVVLNVGQYQLLVADACAGLNSMFTLEALGLLYLNLMKHTALSRTVALAILVIPISFVANVVRVLILVLVTFHFGDEAGQGFVHSFAGMVLFVVGLVLILIVDQVLGYVLSSSRKAL